ncbi:MAG: hypothetical protein D6742_18275, partial [Cyanobacteria bacterium J069]
MGGCTYPHLLNLPSNADGQSLNSPFAQQEPQISGNYLVFVSDRNGSQDVYLYDLPNRHLVDLPGLNAIDMAAEHPSVSADGRFIVFAGSRQGRQDIYLYDQQIQYLRNLTPGIEASVRNPSISADGQRIAYESNASGRWDVVLCDRTGKPLDLLIDPAAKSNRTPTPETPNAALETGKLPKAESEPLFDDRDALAPLQGTQADRLNFAPRPAIAPSESPPEPQPESQPEPQPESTEFPFDSATEPPTLPGKPPGALEAWD